MSKGFKINLKNISKQGLSFFYDQKSQEMTKKLRPLIGDNNYNISIHIQNEGLSSYRVSGAVNTHLNLLCSRCACEFKEPVQKKFKEKIFLQKQRKQKDKKTQNRRFSELMSQESFTTMDHSLFDIGEFLYELIVIEEPLRPLGSQSCDKENFVCERLESIKQELKKKRKSSVFFHENKNLPL